MKPEFTDEENYVIAFYRDRSVSSVSRLNSLDTVRILVSSGFFVYGIVTGDIAWSVVGFGFLLYGNIRGMLETAKYMKVFRGILGKYEAALASSTETDRTTASE